MIYLRSIGHQPRHDVHPSPSVTQLHGGDAEQPSLSTESQKDNRLEQEYTSSQVPSEDQKEDTNDNGNDDDVHSSAFQNKIPLTEADTRPSDTPSSGIEAPSIGNETPPPSQSDGYDHQQLDTASKLDPSLLGVNDINRQSSHPDPAPSVIQLSGEKDNRVEQQYSSQLPLEEQEQDDNKDGHSVFVDGTHLPDYVDDDDDDVCTAPFQSAVFTQSVASTPILGSNSTNMVNDGATCDQEPPSLDEIKAHQGEGLRAQSEHDSHQQTATNDDDARTTPFHIVSLCITCIVGK